MDKTPTEDERLAQIVTDAVTEAMVERRKKIAPFYCFCEDPGASARHKADHEIIRKLGRTLDRIEDTKWKFAMLVITVLVSGFLIATWEGVSGIIKGGK